jgi:hypothetical protein
MTAILEQALGLTVVALILLASAGCKQERQNAHMSNDVRKISTMEEKDPGRNRDAAALKTIATAIQAHGGKEKIMRLQVAHVKYSSSMTLLGKHGQIEVDLYFQMPDRLKKITRGTHGEEKVDLISVVNGDKHWYREGSGSVSLGQSIDLRTAYRPHMILEELVFGLEDEETTLTSIENGEIAGRFLTGVRMKRPGRELTDLYFDRKSGLLTATKHLRVLPGNLKESLQEAFVTEYKLVDGAMLFHLQTQNQDGVKIADLRITEIQTFDKFDDSIFAKP